MPPYEATDSSVSYGACFHDFGLKSGNEKVVCDNIAYKAQTYQKMYESISFNQKPAQYFWYKIIMHPHEATDSSVSYGACFHGYILKSVNEEVVCGNIGYKDQTHQKIV